MFLLMSIGQGKRSKIIEEVISDVKKRRGEGRSKAVTNNKSINQSYEISKTSKTKGISKDTFKMACTHECIPNVKRQIDVQHFEKMTEPEISTLGYLSSDWTFENRSYLICFHGGCVTV